mgnify:CR=1 FL=1
MNRTTKQNLTRFLAAAGVILGFALSAACSAPSIIDPNKAQRDRAEMRAREAKETKALDRSIDKVEQEREDGAEE